MGDVAALFYSALYLAMNLHTNMLPNARDFLNLLEHFCLVGCEKDLMCFSKSLPSHVKVFAWQVLDLESDAIGIDETVKSCKLLMTTTETISSRRKIRVCHSRQSVFGVDISYAYHAFRWGYVQRRNVRWEIPSHPAIAVVQNGWERFYSIDIEHLLALYWSAQSLTVKNSKIPYANSCSCLFPTRPFGKG